MLTTIQKGIWMKYDGQIPPSEFHSSEKHYQIQFLKSERRNKQMQ